MKKIIAAILFLSISGAAWGARYTITIPDNIVNDVVDAIAYQHGYLDVVPDHDDPSGSIPNPESKAAYTKRMLRRWIRLNVKAWEANKAQNNARDQAIIDADAKTKTINVQ